MKQTIDYRMLRSSLRKKLDSQKTVDPLLKQTFGDALFTLTWRPNRLDFASCLPDVLVKHSSDPQVSSSQSESIEEVKDQEVSERKEIFASLDHFVSEQGSVQEKGIEVSFSGGKVIKAASDQFIIEDELLKEDRFNDDLEFYDDVKGKRILFVCEKPGDIEDDKRDQDLLSKMISAMNLEGSYARVFVSKEANDALKSWEKVIITCEREDLIVVSMGAFATNTILRKKERLSKIHGKPVDQTYSWQGQECLVTVFPVFHPDILRINPNMKRSAWLDLQKVMKHLGTDKSKF